MKRLIMLSLPLLMSIGCSEKNPYDKFSEYGVNEEELTVYNQSWYVDDRNEHERSIPFTGKVYRTIEDGKRDKDGNYDLWLWYKGQCTEGFRSGEWTWYYKDGSKEERKTYFHNDGKSKDTITTFWRNGQIKEEFYRVKEKDRRSWKKEGRHVSYHSNGQLSSEEFYKNDKRVDGLYTWYYENGKKKKEIGFKDTYRHGLMTRWWDNGQKASEEDYVSGKRKTTNIYEKDRYIGKVNGKYWDKQGKPITEKERSKIEHLDFKERRKRNKDK